MEQAIVQQPRHQRLAQNTYNNGAAYSGGQNIKEQKNDEVPNQQKFSDTEAKINNQGKFEQIQLKARC